MAWWIDPTKLILNYFESLAIATSDLQFDFDCLVMAPDTLYHATSSFDTETSTGITLGGSIPEPLSATSEHGALEPIAVVGFSLKFPQEAISPDSFWEMLAEKRCAMTEWPKDRINLEAFYHADSNRMDTVRYSLFQSNRIILRPWAYA